MNPIKTDLNAVPVFVAVAESGSFALAAERLALTRSAVTKAVARLEARLGVTLFNRTTRSRSLTSEGALYLEYCATALGALRTGEDALNDGKGDVAGLLRVSMPVLLGHLCLAPLLLELAREHPNLKLDLSFSDRHIDLVADGFDVAVRIGALADSASIMSRKLAEHGMVYCAAPAFLDRHGEPRDVEALRALPAIGFTRRGRVQHWRFANRDQVVDVEPRALFRMDDMRAVADAAAAGFGIAWVPYWLIRDRLGDGTLRSVLDGHAGEPWPVQAMWSRTSHLPRRIRLAVDILARGLPARMATIESPIIRTE